MFRRIVCAVGVHDWYTVDVTSCFTTSYSDRPNWSPIRHMVWYQRCRCCGKRRMRDTVKKDTVYSSRHNGVEHARVAWVEHAQIYLGDGQVKNPTPKKPTLTVIKGKE